MSGRKNATVSLLLAAAWLSAGCGAGAIDGDGGGIADGGAAIADRAVARGDSVRSDGARGDGAVGTPSSQQLAAHWAPVWHHDTDSTDVTSDYIIAYDFDGDTRSDNNWENLKRAGVRLNAVIYYSVVETTTHWFILYTDFHPRDWTERCQIVPFAPDKCHENDMEGAMVVVAKDATRFGRFLLLYTEAHNVLHMFTNDRRVTAFRSKRLEPKVVVTFEKGSHVELYVEAKGHGVCALRYSGSSHCKHPTTGNVFPGGDGIVYRYKGKAEVPRSGNDRDVGYALVPFVTTIWPRRANICDSGCTFDQKMVYEGRTLGKAFDGDTHGKDKANPPWAWDDPDDGPVYRGGFFFRPAETVLTHVKVPGPFSRTYRSNPFL